MRYSNETGTYNFESWQEVYYFLRERAGVDDFFENVIDDIGQVRVADQRLPEDVAEMWAATQSALRRLDAWLPYEDEADGWNPNDG